MAAESYTVENASGLVICSYAPETSVRYEYVHQLLGHVGGLALLNVKQLSDVAKAIVYLHNEPAAVSANLDSGLVVKKITARQTSFVKNVVPQIPEQLQRQDSTNDQLRDLRIVANRLGMYDAADLIRNILER